ncbi:S1C family serine protease [Glutamicibacter endophyticus]|uniref:S1C family serine protease n=1 Tax=Glutamicibacter endophyticus TaxID=1522174 RepID=UPI003AEF5F82
MSQSPNDPRDTSNEQPEPGRHDESVPNSEPTAAMPVSSSDAQPTVSYPRVEESEPSQATTPQAPATQSMHNEHLYAASAPQGNEYGHNPCAGSEQPPLNFPPAPRKSTKKKTFSGSTLLAGMIAAALVGGGSAAATSYFLNSNQSPAAGADGAQPGVVINNPESVTQVTAAAAKAAPSVVTIQSTGSGSSGSGSGVILDNQGHILTNTHVVTLGGAAADPELTVQLNDGSVHQATLVGTDPLSDLAVIKIEASNLVPATLGSSSSLNVGDTAVAIGAPLGLSGTVTDGIISTTNRTISVASSAVPKQSESGNDGGSEFNFQFPGQEQQSPSRAGSIYINVIQTDAAINHGNSGGALVNAKGEVIGVNVAIASAGSGGGEDSGSIGVGFAIPSDYAKRISQELIANGKATHGLLGATVSPQAAGDASRSSQFSVGALIREVSKGSGAEKAGLRSGDVITAVNDRAIQDSSSLTAAIREVQGGGTAEITYRRNGESKTVTATLGTLEN